MHRQYLLAAATAVVAVGLLATRAPASLHLVQIEQVIGGIDGDTSAQAVQLRLRFPSEGFFRNGIDGPAQLVAWDASGDNPVTLLSFPNDVSNQAAGDRALVATAGFDSYTEPGFAPDFTMDPIPVSYLDAGRLTYEDSAGGILWSLAWGGESYTGSTTGATDNDSDGDFGRLPVSLPADSLEAIRFDGSPSDPSTDNESDYILTESPAVFTNNARQSSTIPEPTGLPLLALACALGLRRFRRHGNA